MFLLKVILTNTQVVLLRCGQPLTAIGSKRSREDEKLINHTLGGASKGVIIDTRSQAAAMNSRSKGTTKTNLHFIVELNSSLKHLHTLDNQIMTSFKQEIISSTKSKFRFM